MEEKPKFDLKKSMAIKEHFENVEKEKEYDKLRIELNQIYEDLVTILKTYTDMKEEYYGLVASWIIGTYVHEAFNSYPYLFINAMRGSGKSRLLRLIKTLSHNGRMVISMTESVLFRTAKDSTLCIDEMEGIMRKEKAPLRELLNSCYKKGVKIQRMYKKRTVEGEKQTVEEFEPYAPVVMANIFGMEEVLSDRCITIILEKSRNPLKTKLIEDFDENSLILDLKTRLEGIQCSLCSVVTEKNNIQMWNRFLTEKYTPNTYTTFNTLHTLTTLELKEEEFYNKLDNSNINGRNLELIFPLLSINYFLGDERFDYSLGVLRSIVEERQGEELTESRDVALYEFISQQLESGFVSVKKLTNDFRNYLGEDEDEERWLNVKWVGRALRRLNLTLDKRRISSGTEVRLNTKKAYEQMAIFKGEKGVD
jgi:hypothetical protein